MDISFTSEKVFLYEKLKNFCLKYDESEHFYLSSYHGIVIAKKTTNSDVYKILEGYIIVNEKYSTYCISEFIIVEILNKYNFLETLKTSISSTYPQKMFIVGEIFKCSHGEHLRCYKTFEQLFYKMTRDIDGKDIAWFDNGRLQFTRDVKNGHPYGFCEYADLHGMFLERTNYKNGLLSGLYEKFHKKNYEDDQLIIKCYYKKGLTHGQYEHFYSDGTPFIKCHYIKNKKNGQYEKFYKGDKIKIRTQFIDNTLDGVFETFYLEKCTHRIKAHFIKGKLDGMCEFWSANGIQIAKIEFKNGFLNGIYEIFDLYGSLIITKNQEMSKPENVFESYVLQEYNVMIRMMYEAIG